MQIKELSIANVKIKNNVFLAPMAGYTDYCFRHLQLEQGVGLAFTELVSAKGLMYGSNGSKELLYSGEDISSTAVQLFGADPYYMRSACESEMLKDFNIVDINMGCPVPKVYKNGEGSALLADMNMARSVVSECVKSGKVITAKIRTGLKYGDDIASEYTKMLEDEGVSLITIHGRVREAYYSGEVDYKAIEKAKKSVKIPVIANGGIFTLQDANLMIERTGADGVMLARGAIANPFLSALLTKTKTRGDLKKYILDHVNLRRKHYNERVACVEFRKFVPYYFKGMDGVKDLKNALVLAQNTDQILQLIEQNF